MFWDEAEVLYENLPEAPAGGWETVVVDNSTAPDGSYRAYPGRIGLGSAYRSTSIAHPSETFSTLVHEAWHVNDFASGRWVRLGAAVDWVKGRFGVDPYNPVLTRGSLGSYGIENRATIIEWQYRVANGLGVPWNSPSNFPRTPAQQFQLFTIGP